MSRLWLKRIKGLKYPRNEPAKEIEFMDKLNRTKLAIVWIMSLIFSGYILVPVIKIERFHKYKARDGNLMNFRQRPNEEQNQYGYYAEIGGKRFYYKGSYYKYSLNERKHLYERIILITLLNGILLIYTLRPSKQLSKSKHQAAMVKMVE